MSEYSAGDMADNAAKGFSARDEEVAKLIQQRDGLLAIMNNIPGWMGGEWAESVRAAITNATTTERT